MVVDLESATNLEHGQKQVLFATLILIPVNREHDCLQQRIYLRHRDKATQMGDMPGLGLEQEKQVSVFLGFVVIGEDTLLHFGGVFEMTRNFILLRYRERSTVNVGIPNQLTSSKAMRFWMRRAMRESRYRTSFSKTKFFLDWDEILALSSRRTFCAAEEVSRAIHGGRVIELGGPPLARSSSITRSDSFADMDMYSADMEYRLDWRADRDPS